MQLFRWFNRHGHWFRLLVFITSGLPALVLLWNILRHQLGYNPFETLMARTGFWSMVFLIITLAITPLRRWLSFLCKILHRRYGKRLADWNFLIRSRRMLGLYSLFYLSWHAAIYLHLELNWQGQWLWQDLQERPFLVAGLAGWCLSLLLGVTSPKVLRRKLGKRWRQLHRAMYALSILAVIHVLLEAKLGEREAPVYAALVGVLLMHRVLVNSIKRWQRSDDNGLEAKR
ncbi:MAG: sulfoxide reductase heme-binding subunit YedZ [Alcanivorax sp.]|nr:MAG: sulfoxide reductase heme-binding subunit YedZ [Alcanivorax sp.]